MSMYIHMMHMYMLTLSSLSMHDLLSDESAPLPCSPI